MLYHDFWRSDLDLPGCPTLKKIVLDYDLNQGGYLLLLFTYGCRRRAMLSFWQLWLLLSRALEYIKTTEVLYHKGPFHAKFDTLDGVDSLFGSKYEILIIVQT